MCQRAGAPIQMGAPFSLVWFWLPPARPPCHSSMINHFAKTHLPPLSKTTFIHCFQVPPVSFSTVRIASAAPVIQSRLATMGMLRKKDKRNKHSGEQSKSSSGRHRNSAKGNEKDSLTGPIYSDPYSPSVTDNSSLLSGDSKTTGRDTKRSSRGRDDSKGPWFTSRQIRLFRKPPPAEQAAYAGPPRYDWVDIVSPVLLASSFSVMFGLRTAADMCPLYWHRRMAISKAPLNVCSYDLFVVRIGRKPLRP